MWAAGGNTQYKSHLDLCHAFNWLLCRCHGCPLPSLLSLSSSLARLPSISYEIEFGGGQRLKNTSGKVCAGLACCGMAGPAVCLNPGQLRPPFCQQLKANFSGRHLRGFSDAIKNEFRAASLAQKPNANLNIHMASRSCCLLNDILAESIEVLQRMWQRLRLSQ